MDESVLHLHLTSTRFRNSLVALIRDLADNPRSLFEGRGVPRTQARHVSALRGLAGAIENSGAENQMMVAAHRIAFALDHQAIRRGEVPLTRRQNQLLQVLGTSVAAPPPDALLAEFVAVGLEDTLELNRKAIERAEGERKQGEVRSKRLERQVADLESSLDAASAAQRQLEAAQAEIAELRRTCEAQAATISGQIEAAERGEGVREAGKRARIRQLAPVKLEGEVGIYRVALADGSERFELTFRDDEGTSRKRRLEAGTTLDEAREARARLNGSRAEDGSGDTILTDGEADALERGEAELEAGDEATGAEPDNAATEEVVA